MRTITRGDPPQLEPFWLRRTDGAALLYPGRVHDIHSEPSLGKTWLALHAVREVLDAGGAVIVIDYEDDGRMTDARLKMLGLDSDTIGDRARFRYLNPTGGLGRIELEHLDTVLDELNAELVVFDALASALAQDGVDENDNGPVTAWGERVVKHVARRGAAVLLLDHVTKDPATRQRGGRGAGAKLALIDGASYEMRGARPFSKHNAGKARLVIAKDRPGGVGAIGDVAAVVRFTPDSDHLGVELQPSDEDANASDVGSWPVEAMEAISRALERTPDGLSMTKLVRDTGCVHGFNSAAKDRALAMLVREGYVTVEKGPRGAKVHRLARPYPDPEPDPARPCPQSAPGRVSDPAPLPGSIDPAGSGTHEGRDESDDPAPLGDPNDGFADMRDAIRDDEPFDDR